MFCFKGGKLKSHSTAGLMCCCVQHQLLLPSEPGADPDPGCNHTLHSTDWLIPLEIPQGQGQGWGSRSHSDTAHVWHTPMPRLQCPPAVYCCFGGPEAFCCLFWVLFGSHQPFPCPGNDPKPVHPWGLQEFPSWSHPALPRVQVNHCSL